MNKAYRSIWNEASATWEAVPENARGKGKSRTGAGIVKTVAVLGLAGLAVTAHADEVPVGSQGVLLSNEANDQGSGDVTHGVTQVEAQTGSGVDTTGLNVTYNTAAYYSQVSGTGDGTGLTPPSDMARAVGGGAVAIGSNAYTPGTASVALGVQSYAPAKDAVALGSGSVANQADTVSVGSDGTGSYVAYDAHGKPYTIENPVNTRRIVNMAAGQSDTDAANVGQLRGVASALGGGASVGTDGVVQAPGYEVQGEMVHDVGSALSSLDAGVTGNTAQIASLTNNIENGTIGLVQQDLQTRAITVASATGGTTVDFAGTAGARQLEGVAMGTANTDALDVAQMKSAGFALDGEGNVLNGALTYNAGSVASGNPTVTLNPGTGESQYYVDGNRQMGHLAAGTVISNVANGIQDTDAANVGQVYDIVNEKAPTSYGSLSSMSATRLDAAASNGSGVNTTGLNVTYNTAAYYSQVSGEGDSTGLTPPSDVARAFGDGAVAIGSNAYTPGTASVALGVQSYAPAKDAVALGSGSVANQADTVSVGSDGTGSYVAYDAHGKPYTIENPVNTRRIVNMAAGQADTDAANVGQLRGVASALGGGASVGTDGSVHAPSYVISGGTYGDVGQALQAVETVAQTGAADAVKYDTSAHTRVTFDGGPNGTMLSNVAAGAADLDAVNVAQLKAAGLHIDTGGNVTNAFVAYDDTTKASITLGGATGTKITNLSAGSASGDAVNGGQLRSLALMLGSGADLAADGSIVAPTYHMQGATQKTVGGALDALDTGLTSLQQQIGDSGIGLVAQDPVSRAITVGANTNGSIVNFSGAAGNRVLTGVAAGAVNATSVDAINGAQLYASTQSTAAALGGGAAVNADGTLAAPSYTVGGTTVHTVGDAITNLDGRVTQNTTEISNLQTTVTNMAGSVQNAVQYDSSAHDQVTLGGTGTTSQVKLTNLADALLSATSTDAVTGAQLYATNMQVATLGQEVQNAANAGSQYLSVKTSAGPAAATGTSSVAVGGGASASGTSSTAIGDQAQATGNSAVALGVNSVASRDNSVSVGSVGNERQITNVAAGTAPTDAVNLGQLNSAVNGMNGRIDDVDRDARRGIAASAALNIVTPYLPGRTTLNAGVASYRGQAALGIGLSRWNEKGTVNYNLGVSSAGGNSTIVRAGIGIVFGR